MRQSSLRRVFPFRGIAPRSHTGWMRTCLVLFSDPRRGCYMGLMHRSFFFFFFLSFFFLFFPPRFCPGHISGTVTRRDSKLSVLLGPAVQLCTVAYHPIRFVNFFFYFIYFFFFCQDFVRAISLEQLLAEAPNWMCCLVLRSNFALLLTIQFALLFFFFFSATILSGPYVWNRYSQRLQIECAAWSCGLILHCCLPSNSLRYFFFPPQFFFFAEIFFFFCRDFFFFFFSRHDFVRAIPSVNFFINQYY